jgi:DNA-binding HxlR family transcriptional regulator
LAGKRTYQDPCGIARALDVVGERWALLVVRELLLGPKRFTDLRAGLRHVGPDVLAQRLRELEEGGVVRRTKLPAPAGSRVYELTEWGRELEPVVLGLGRWGTQVPFPRGQDQLGVDSFVLALKTLFQSTRAAGLAGAYDLRLGEHAFEARVHDGRLDVTRGAARDPDATISSDPGTLQEVLWHGRSLPEALQSEAITLAGDRHAAKRFLALFPLPG